MNIFIFFISLFSTIFFTPYAIRIGSKYMMDISDQRKRHNRPRPRSGGLVLYGLILIWSIFSYSIRIYLIPISLIFVVGVLDDIYSLPAKVKLFFQIVAGCILYLIGVKIDFISIGSLSLAMNYFAAPFTILYIVGTMNAFNLIDGLDGLSPSLSVISLISLFTISILINDLINLPLILVTLGYLLSFLFYNLHPAKIFLGDCGSLLLGLIISIMSINVIYAGHNPQILGIIMISFIPVIDTIWTILRRFFSGKHIFHADRGHIHHKFLDAGFTDFPTYIIIVIISLTVAITGVFTLIYPNLITMAFAIFQIILTVYVSYNPAFIFKLYSYKKVTKLEVKS